MNVSRQKKLEEINQIINFKINLLFVYESYKFYDYLILFIMLKSKGY
jgi:hypothetical protein